MKKLWNFLSGKKSVIAGVLAITFGFLQAKGVIDAETASYLLGLATLILGVGVVHKIGKSVKK